MPAGVLEAMLRQEGVRAERRLGEEDIERRGVDWSTDVQVTLSAIVATGSTAAIGVALGRFKKRFPKASVEVAEGDQAKDAEVEWKPAEPDDGGFLGP